MRGGHSPERAVKSRTLLHAAGKLKDRGTSTRTYSKNVAAKRMIARHFRATLVLDNSSCRGHRPELRKSKERSRSKYLRAMFVDSSTPCERMLELMTPV